MLAMILLELEDLNSPLERRLLPDLDHWFTQGSEFRLWHKYKPKWNLDLLENFAECYFSLTISILINRCALSLADYLIFFADGYMALWCKWRWGIYECDN